MSTLVKILDAEGFLRDLSQWSPSIAELIAEQDAIDLKDAHWEIIELQRNYYETYKIAPVTRVLIKMIYYILDQMVMDFYVMKIMLYLIKIIYLMKLFTGKPAKISAKIAGLPKPTNCD